MNEKTKAITSLILGLVSLGAWLLPFIGLPVSITGIVMGIQSMKSEHKNVAIAGLVLSIIGLLVTIGNMILGAIVAVDMIGYL